MEGLSSTKLVPGAEKVGDLCLGAQSPPCGSPRHTATGGTAHITFHVILLGVVLKGIVRTNKGERWWTHSTKNSIFEEVGPPYSRSRKEKSPLGLRHHIESQEARLSQETSDEEGLAWSQQKSCPHSAPTDQPNWQEKEEQASFSGVQFREGRGERQTQPQPGDLGHHQQR